MAVLVPDLAVIQDRGLVELHPAPMDGFRKWYLVWMEIFPAALAHNVMKQIFQNILYRI